MPFVVYVYHILQNFADKSFFIILNVKAALGRRYTRFVTPIHLLFILKIPYVLLPFDIHSILNEMWFSINVSICKKTKTYSNTLTPILENL